MNVANAVDGLNGCVSYESEMLSTCMLVDSHYSTGFVVWLLLIHEEDFMLTAGEKVLSTTSHSVNYHQLLLRYIAVRSLIK